MKKNITIVILLLSSVPLFFIGISDVQSWGDDYAQYLKEGLNISEGKPYYQSNYIFNDLNTEYAPASYPPGFPMIMAPLIFFTGIAIKPILYLITLLIAALIFLHYYFFRKHFGKIASTCLAIISVYCPAVIDLKGYVLSDIPLLFFTSLYFVVRQSVKISNFKLCILIVSSVMAVLTRSQGIILMAAEGLVLFVYLFKLLKENSFEIKKIFESISLKILVGFSLLYISITWIVFPSPKSAINYYSGFFLQHSENFFMILKTNFFYLIELLLSFFGFENTHLVGGLLISIACYTALITALFTLIFASKKLDRLHIYFFLLMCLLILLLPVHQGLRFLLPILPIYLLFVAKGSDFIFNKVPEISKRITLIILTLLFIFLGKDNYNRIPYQQNWTPYTTEDSIAFSFIKKNIPDTSIIVFTKPRALTLYTNKRTMNIAWQVNHKVNTQRFNSLGIKYILFRKELDEQFITNYLRHCKCALDSQKIGKLYTLYAIR